MSEFANQLLSSKDFFSRSTRILEEADSGFSPTEGMMTVAQQVAHTAQTVAWFVQGATRREGFDLDFEKLALEIQAVTSLASAREMLDSAFGNAVAWVQNSDPQTLAKPLPEGPVMGCQPASDVIWGIIEHTAHHRGALTVYSRALGRVPPMPYGD